MMFKHHNTSRGGRLAFIAVVVLALSVPFSCAVLAADLFQPVPPAAPRGDTEQRLLDRIRSLPTTKEVQVVTINRDALRDRTITLALPDARRVTATERRRDVRSDQNFTWHGSLADIPGDA